MKENGVRRFQIFSVMCILSIPVNFFLSIGCGVFLCGELLFILRGAFE
jgi:hypothetical protein